MVIFTESLDKFEKKNSIFFNKQPVFYSMNSDVSKISLKHDQRKVVLLDIDDTLYKTSVDLLCVRRRKMKSVFEKFLSKQDSFEKSKNDLKAELNQTIFEKLNVTPIVFEKEINIRYEEFIERDERLIDYLSKTNCRFWCFTNAVQYKAEGIINKLGISELIEGVICTDDHILRPISKPMEESYKFVENILGISDVNRNSIYFFDDKKENLDFAKDLGWNVGLVDSFDHIVDVMKRNI